MPRGGEQVIPRPAAWRPGPPAPWADLDRPDTAIDLPRIRTALAARGPARPASVEGNGARRSAVLAPLYEDEGTVWVITTRRSRALRTHSGEVSFPGGLEDPGDDGPVGTALREAHEEIGLPGDLVEIIGELDHLTTVSSDRFIVPLVGVLERVPPLVPSPHEVDAIVHVDLRELLTPGVYRQELWGGPAIDHPVSFFEIEGETIWGATAAMLRQFLAVVLGVE